MKRTQTPIEAAEVLGCHEDTIRRHCNAKTNPCPHTRLSNGQLRVDAGELVAWSRKHNVTWQPGRPKSQASADLDAARLRKENALADRWELVVARERGKLLDADEVERTWTNIGQVIRNELQTLGSRLVPVALRRGMPPGESATFQVEIEAIANDILKRLSENGDDNAGDGAAVLAEPVPAAEVDAEPVGGAGAASPV